MDLPAQFRSEPHGGHVLTADVQLAEIFLTQARGIQRQVATNVVGLLQQGTNYRPLAATHLTTGHIRQVIIASKRAVTKWVHTLCMERECSITMTSPFVEFIPLGLTELFIHYLLVRRWHIRRL